MKRHREEGDYPLTAASRVISFISEFPGLIYDGISVYCNPCQKPLRALKRSDCLRHIQRQEHIENTKHKVPYWRFLYDIIFTFSVCNIPHNVLDKPQFREFWEKYNAEWALPTSRQVRRQFPNVKNHLQETITYELRNKKLWVTVDETTDAKNNKVGNVLVRNLNPVAPSKSYLLASERLEQTDSETIIRLVSTALTKFEIHKSSVLMLVTNGAEYMCQAGADLKKIYTNLLHVTCMLHTLHKVVEEIRQYYSKVDKLVTSTKQVFAKAVRRVEEFHKACPGIPEPPQSVSSKWGTWLPAALYYTEHFEQTKSVMLSFDPKEANSIRASQQLFRDIQVREDLLVIEQNYSIIPVAVEELKNSALPLSEALKTMENVSRALEALTDGAGVCVAGKFKSMLNSSTDIDKLLDIGKSLCDGCADDFQKCFAYANITSLDVDRSFSKYALTFAPQRQNLSENSLEGLLMMQVYSEER